MIVFNNGIHEVNTIRKITILEVLFSQVELSSSLHYFMVREEGSLSASVSTIELAHELRQP